MRITEATIRVFCDFDGTAAAEDVGNRLFRTFAGEEAASIVERYLSGEITARECLMAECAAVRHLTPEALGEFVDRFELDPYFKPFVEFCEAKTIPLTILSDGLDFYVGRILHNHGLDRLRWFANHLEFVPVDGRTKIIPSFPYADAECTDCGNCKRNHLLTLSADDDIIVYIGDGISDRCPIRYADIVFAKRRLIRYCQQQNITYFDFRTFDDVTRKLDEILRRKRLKKRWEAEVARRQAFLQG